MRLWSRADGRLLVVIVVTLAVAGAVLLMLWPCAGSCITEANFCRIADGMTEQEVEDILGCPAGDYTDGMAVQLASRRQVGDLNEREWLGYGGRITLRLKSGRTVEKRFSVPSLLRQPTWVDRLRQSVRDRLGL
jgi:hypothetical protein